MSITTPYDGQRQRIRWMEGIEVLRGDVSAPVARQRVARATGLSADQLVNIRKGKLKGLYEEAKRRIDEAFIRSVQRQIKDLNHELAVARESVRAVDPGVVAKAEASLHALEQLIAEARAAGVMPPDPGARS